MLRKLVSDKAKLHKAKLHFGEPSYPGNIAKHQTCHPPTSSPHTQKLVTPKKISLLPKNSETYSYFCAIVKVCCSDSIDATFKP